jgi:transketolase
MSLSRQNLPILDRSKAEGDVSKGAYVLVPGDGPTIVATGSEVWVAVEAAEKLGGGVRVVSMPSWELFEQQDESYKASVLGDREKTVSVEAGISLGWDRYAATHVAIDRFGASAPGTEVLERLGINVDNVVKVVGELV